MSEKRLHSHPSPARYGQWALITGASAGIGKTFAKELASRGFNLVLVARRQSLLDELAANLSTEYRVQTQTLTADLSKMEEVEKVLDDTEHLDIGLLIPNAGIEVHETFDQQSWNQVAALMDTNVAAPTRMAHHFAGKMRAKGRGGILFVSSMMAFIPSAYFAQYAASKGYIQMLAEGIHQELKDAGVDVITLAPGLTDTDMGANVAKGQSKMITQGMMSAEDVVTAALNGLGKKPSVVPGFMNRMTVFLVSRLLPRTIAPAAIAKFYKSV